MFAGIGTICEAQIGEWYMSIVYMKRFIRERHIVTDMFINEHACVSMLKMSLNEHELQLYTCARIRYACFQHFRECLLARLCSMHTIEHTSYL